MKKPNFFLLFFFFPALFFALIIPAKASGEELKEKLAGRILLQVEEKGQAWYIDPTNKNRIFLGQPTTAFRIMRELGLGISNKDLKKIAQADEQKSNSRKLAKKLAGRILLAVENKGEAWYVNPLDYKRYYLGRPAEAFVLMQKLGMGVSNDDLKKIPASPADSYGSLSWSVKETIFRGANIESILEEKDFRDFAAWGGNLIRINFSFSPLMEKNYPYGFNEESFAYLTRVLDWCEKYKIYAVIDPHTAPGFQNDTHTNFNDPFWTDFFYHEQLIKLWREIASRYKNRGPVIAGYDLLNEPFIPAGGATGTPADYNLLVEKLAKNIRGIDPRHSLIVEIPEIMPAGKNDPQEKIDRFAAAAYLAAPPAENIIYESHLYEPLAFTHQLENEAAIAYPGIIEEKEWNKEALITLTAPLQSFGKKYQTPIFLGEFSAVRWSKASGGQYLKDIIDICEENNWSWAYHSFRGAGVWNAEMSDSKKDDLNYYSLTSRTELLKSSYRLNLNNY